MGIPRHNGKGPGAVGADVFRVFLDRIDGSSAARPDARAPPESLSGSPDRFQAVREVVGRARAEGRRVAVVDLVVPRRADGRDPSAHGDRRVPERSSVPGGSGAVVHFVTQADEGAGDAAQAYGAAYPP